MKKKKPARVLRIIQAMIDYRMFQLDREGNDPELKAQAKAERDLILSEVSQAKRDKWKPAWLAIRNAADATPDPIATLSELAEAFKQLEEENGGEDE